MLNIANMRPEDMIYYLEVMDGKERLVFMTYTLRCVDRIHEVLGFKGASAVADESHKYRVRESISADEVVDAVSDEYYITEDEIERVRELVRGREVKCNRSKHKLCGVYKIFGKIPAEMLAGKYGVDAENGEMYRLRSSGVKSSVGYTVGKDIPTMCRHKVEMYLHEYVVCLDKSGKLRVIDCNVDIMIFRYQYIAFRCGKFDFLINDKRSLKGWEVDHINGIRGMDNGWNLQVIKKQENIKRYHEMVASGELNRVFDSLGLGWCKV